MAAAVGHHPAEAAGRALLSLGKRQLHPRDRAAAVARQQVEAAAVQACDAIDDREPQSGARRAVAARARLVRAREGLLQPFHVAGREEGIAAEAVVLLRPRAANTQQ